MANPNTIAMQDNRSGWKMADVHHTTMLLPGPYREYLKGMIAVLNGITLLNYVELHDEDVLMQFSDKQPRLPFTEVDIRVEMKHCSDAMRQDYETLLEKMAERIECQQMAKEAVEQNDELAARYWFARDYAISYLIRGSYKMLQEEKAGRGLPEGLIGERHE